MFRTFALFAMAGVLNAASLDHEGRIAAARPQARAPRRAAPARMEAAPARMEMEAAPKRQATPKRQALRAPKKHIALKRRARKSEGYVPYSTSYAEPAKTSCRINPYRPDLIHRARLPEAPRGVGQYRSVNWGKDGYYSSWRDIDVLDQPAAYEKPSFTRNLITPDGQIYNDYKNLSHKGLYGGIGGVMRRSEGIDYSKPVWKRTACNGYRRDTLSTEYLHTDAPSPCVSQYVEPKPWQCYPGHVDDRQVYEAGVGVAKVDEDAPLEYPEYTSEVYEYSRPVVQDYTVTKSAKHDPEYIPYHAPHYDFLEYEPEAPVEVLPTYYKAPKVYGEESYGYIPEPEYVEKKEYPINRKGYDYYVDAEPMAVLPRYPKKPVQTYSQNPVEKTQLQADQYAAGEVHHELYPASEHVDYHEPMYGPPRPEPKRTGGDLRAKEYAPESQQLKYKRSYKQPQYAAVQTKYGPQVTKSPYTTEAACATCYY